MLSDIKNTSQEKSNIILIKKVRDNEKSNFFEYVGVMINAGIGLTEALESVQDKITNIYFKQKINELYLFVSSGDSFSKSMKKLAQIFSQNEISVVEAGESTGTLDSSLLNLSTTIRKRHDLKRKIKGALTYPLIIFLFLIVAILIVLTYVIPTIMPLFENAEAELPMMTKALISTSDFIKNNFFVIFLFIFTIFVLFVGYRSTESGKEKLDNILLNIPLIGKVYKNYILANIASSLGNLIGAGVPTIKVLRLVGKSSGSVVYENIFAMITKKVESGEKIVDSMRQVDEEVFYFPAIYLQMLSVGEKTANMEDMSKKIYKQYTREVDYSLENMMKWVEPLAIVIASVFVLWFAFAIIGAITKITTVIN